MAASGIGPIAGLGAGMAQALRVEGETLTTFKNRVDALLKQLEESKAAPHRIAHGALPAGRLGNFDEADELHTAYTHVHSQLEKLSKTLALQIEGLVVTVDASKSGYDNLDADVRDRLSRIRIKADDLLRDHSGHGAKERTGSGSSGMTGHNQHVSGPSDADAGGL
ncbi:hypothetical protein AQI88_23370 [Streptomyces cellostaticus]|uniref:Uncharacterized protein n=2 Tax=Streptomyces cellostaticus TaxID=67285 RepID=A0A117PVG7_9ACTN|nr:hypothetical protein AQI88_23370 [Streptomyces cellostaticus]